MKRTFIIFFIFFVLWGCSINKRLTQDTLSIKISKWKEFTLKGLITLNYKQFRFIKNIKIIKDTKKMSINIYDGGVFGVMNQMIFKAVIDSTISINSTLNADFDFNFSINDIDNFLDDMLLHKDSIRKTKLFNKGAFKFFFNKDFEISKILYKNYILVFNYTNKLKTVKLYQDKYELVNIQIDQLIFGDEK